MDGGTLRLRTAPHDAAAGPTRALARMALLHRYRFVAPMCAGRTVRDLSRRARTSRDLLASHGARVLRGAGTAAEIVLCMDVIADDELSATLARVASCMSANGVLILALGPGADTVPGFRHVRLLRQRPLLGSVMIEDAYSDARLVPLASGRRSADCAALAICGNASLPDIASMMVEADPLAFAWRARLDDPPPEAPPPPLPDHQAEDWHARAVAFAERLVAVDATVFGLRQEIARLSKTNPQRPEDPGSSAPHQEPRHPWKLADDPGCELSQLGLYDRRPDDDAILQSRIGEGFLSRFALTGASPDVAGAIEALNAIQRMKPEDDRLPDASIVIPVYGQLAFTLNCLHSLLAHASRYRTEIIVVDDSSPDDSGIWLAKVRSIRLLCRERNGGFIASSNDGAAIARGRIVIMLNNDTRVIDGWLDALLDSFNDFPNAGLVGSKLLYPDGTLQEAGGIIWRDGSAWNDGRNDDPGRPRYCVARQVDYVSGCSVAVPIDLWRSLGGFDTLYAPAYCEDADLAMRVRAAGHQVWLQPASRVIHYEGKTSGTSTASGAKAYQTVNARKLFIRWRDTLAHHRPNGREPWLERERGVRKRALVIDAVNPTPKQDAGSVTAVLTMRLFQRLGYKVHFVPQDNFLYEPAAVGALQRLGIEVAYAPYDVGFENYIRRCGHMFDVVFVFRAGVLEATLADLRAHAPQAPLLFHVMDLHFLRMAREAELSGAPDAAQAADRMKQSELRLIGGVDCVITHSTFERDLLDAAVPDVPAIVWPFMFEAQSNPAAFNERRDFIFLGGYRHAPNIDAVTWFVRDIFPLILCVLPDSRFIIAGANPPPNVLDLASEHVAVTGMIDDLQPVMGAARVFICPLRVGAGTKGKVSTAMAHGLPVVTTSCGAEGMGLVDGEDVLLADDPEEFAAACIRVHQDEALWAKLSGAGRALVESRHSLAMGERTLHAAIETGLQMRLGLHPPCEESR